MKWCMCVFLCVWFHTTVMAQTLNDSLRLIGELKLKYNGNNKHVRPLLDQTQAVEVTSTVFLETIKGFDEVQGILTTMITMRLFWTDAHITWNSSEYGGITWVHLIYDEVWVPEISLINPTETFRSVGYSGQMIAYLNDGRASWSTDHVLSSYCEANVEKYPFDTQVCSVAFRTTHYSTDEVVLTSSRNGVNMILYRENANWELVHALLSRNNSTRISSIKMELKMKRRPDFIVVNVITPIIILGLLNTFAFLLPVDCGERMSYCITVLLSITVFITIISDTLPRHGSPLPLICFKLILDIGTSALITLISICNIRLSKISESTKVPSWLTTLVLHKNGKQSIFDLPSKQTELENIPQTTSSSSNHVPVDMSQTPVSEDESVNNCFNEHIATQRGVTWKEVSGVIDSASFVFLVVHVLGSVLLICACLF